LATGLMSDMKWIWRRLWSGWGWRNQTGKWFQRQGDACRKERCDRL